jgi:hypothetical protein
MVWMLGFRHGFILQNIGEVVTIAPATGKVFSMEELRGYVGGGVEILTMPDGRRIAVNEMGKFSGLPANTRASEE